jgi:hypothetical protein
MPHRKLTELVTRVERVMDDLQDWLVEQENTARSNGDRQAAQRWSQRRLRLRAHRQGLLTMLTEDSEPPPT